MTTLSVALPEDLKVFIEGQVARAGLTSAGDYLLTLVREAQRREAKRALEAKLLEALESGPSEPMTREDWEDIEREGLDRLAREREHSAQ